MLRLTDEFFLLRLIDGFFSLLMIITEFYTTL